MENTAIATPTDTSVSTDAPNENGENGGQTEDLSYMTPRQRKSYLADQARNAEVQSREAATVKLDAPIASAEDVLKQVGGKPDAKPSTKPDNKPTDAKPSDPPAKKYTVKNKGKDVEVDEKEYHRLANHGYEAQEAIQRGRMQEQRALQFLAKLKESPIQTLVDYVGTEQAQKAIESFLTERIKFDMLPEVERDLHMTKEELKRYKAIEDEQKRQKEEHEFETLTNQRIQHITTEIADALKDSPLPSDDNDVITRVATYMKKWTEMELKKKAANPQYKPKPAVAKQLVSLVVEDLKKESDRAKAILGKKNDRETIRQPINPYGTKYTPPANGLPKTESMPQQKHETSKQYFKRIRKEIDQAMNGR